MSVLILTHPSSHEHVTPPGHPERVARIETTDRVLARPEFATLPRREASAATDEALKRAHTDAYVEGIKRAAPATGSVSLDPDTHMSPGSLEAARRAAGSNIDGVEAVLKGEVKAAFCAVRPCGHHAEKERAMGFCLFNNVAVGARHATEAMGLEPCRDHRFRRASRQWHTGHLLGRSAGVLRLVASVPALPRNRGGAMRPGRAIF